MTLSTPTAYAWALVTVAMALSMAAATAAAALPAEAPLTLSSAYDERGHSSARVPTIGKDNPFSIAPGEKSLISNPSGVITSLFDGVFEAGPGQLK